MERSNFARIMSQNYPQIYSMLSRNTDPDSKVTNIFNHLSDRQFLEKLNVQELSDLRGCVQELKTNNRADFTLDEEVFTLIDELCLKNQISEISEAGVKPPEITADSLRNKFKQVIIVLLDIPKVAENWNQIISRVKDANLYYDDIQEPLSHIEMSETDGFLEEVLKSLQIDIEHREKMKLNPVTWAVNILLEMSETDGFLEEVLKSLQIDIEHREKMKLNPVTWAVNILLSLSEKPGLRLDAANLAVIANKNELKLMKFESELLAKSKKKIQELDNVLSQLKAEKKIFSKDAYINLGCLEFESVNLLVERSRQNHPDLNCFVCKSLKELSDCFMALKNSSFVGKISFLTYSGKISPGMDSAHVSPVLIEKFKDGSIKIAITDSIGDEGMRQGQGWDASDYDKRNEYEVYKSVYGQMYLMNLYYALRAPYPTKSDLNFSLDKYPEIYIYAPKRQRDESSCSIISNNDATQFINIDLFKDIEERGQLKSSIADGKVYYFSMLPPAFIKLTQRHEVLESFKSNAKYDLKKFNQANEKNSLLEFPKGEHIRYIKTLHRYINTLEFLKNKLEEFREKDRMSREPNGMISFYSFIMRYR